MPKEVIWSADQGTDGDPAPVAELGWSREVGHVQLGTVRRVDHGPNTRSIVDVLRDDLAFVDKHRNQSTWTGESNYAHELERIIAVYESGWFVPLTRDGCNRMIRALRKARDAAFGADA